jgi:hypothetical protein
MREVVLNELADVLRREVEALEAVIAEELRGLGMIQRLGNVGVNLGKKLGGMFPGPQNPNQTDVLKPATVSDMVGRSGR